MDKVALFDLLEKCLEGSAEQSEQEALIAELHGSAALRAAAFRIVAMDSILHTAAYEAESFARRFMETLSQKGDEKEFANNVVGRLREETGGADLRLTRSIQPLVRVRRIRWSIAAAAAAAIVILGLAEVFQRFEQVPQPAGDGMLAQSRVEPGTSGTAVKPTTDESVQKLAQFRQEAAEADSVENLHAMAEAAVGLYQEEVERGTKCNTLKLVHLGVSVAITLNPKEDRQAEDLRFLLARAEQASRSAVAAASILPRSLSLIQTAGAAEVNPSLEDHHRFISFYHEARKAATAGKYDEWEQYLAKAAQIVAVRADRDILDALTFERLYVRYYERSLPCTRDEFERLPDRWSSDAPGRKHFESHILSDMDRHAAAQRALAINLSRSMVTERGTPDGRWRVDTRNGIAETAQTDLVPNSLKGFDTPDFREAIVVGQHRIDDMREGTPREGSLSSLGIYFPNPQDSRTWGPGLARLLDDKWKGRWMWTWHHLKYVGDGVWECQSAYWWEGSQPLAPWDVEDFATIDPTFIEGKVVWQSQLATSGSLPDAAAGIALGTCDTAATWRALTFKLITGAAATGGRNDEGGGSQ